MDGAPGTGVPVPPAERVLSRLGAARRRLSSARPHQGPSPYGCSFSPRASISTNWRNRRSRVSAFFAVCSLNSTA